jgi:hypothetical protein
MCNMGLSSNQSSQLSGLTRTGRDRGGRRGSDRTRPTTGWLVAQSLRRFPVATSRLASDDPPGDRTGVSRIATLAAFSCADSVPIVRPIILEGLPTAMAPSGMSRIGMIYFANPARAIGIGVWLLAWLLLSLRRFLLRLDGEQSLYRLVKR